MTYECDRETNGQTDRLYHNKCSDLLRYAAKILDRAGGWQVRAFGALYDGYPSLRPCKTTTIIDR